MNLLAQKSSNAELVANVKETLQDKIDCNQFDLPLLPEVANQALALTQDQNADAAAMANLIHKDQSVAGHLLQIANSPLYMPKSEILSLQHAVARLGFRVISEIVLAMVVKGKVFNVRGHEATVKYLWKHSLASGIWAKEIARILRVNVESAFLCGLLHEIGKPTTLQTIQDIEKDEVFKIDKNSYQELMEQYHIEIGVLLAKKWKLPAPVIESIRFFDRYGEATNFAKDAMIVNCAEQFATAMLAEEPLDEEKLHEIPVIAALNLYQDDIATLIEKEDKVLETIRAMG